MHMRSIHQKAEGKEINKFFEDETERVSKNEK
jgi:hypothetical protein